MLQKHQQTAEYTFFSSIHETVTKMDYILGHKTNLNSLNIEIVQSIFSHQSGIKLEIKNRNIPIKFSNIWKFKNILLNYSKKKSNEKL